VIGIGNEVPDTPTRMARMATNVANADRGGALQRCAGESELLEERRVCVAKSDGDWVRGGQR